MKKVGLIINPVAGIGGRAGLKGSDGPETLKAALELGAEPQAQNRARTAVEQLLPISGNLEFLTYGGSMGQDMLSSLGLSPKVLGQPADPSTPEDTCRAAKAMADEGAELILFAGGDGTARDICGAIGEAVTVIGIPAGVKIHSAVYALNPRSAGFQAREYLSGSGGSAPAEVMDIDEELFRSGRVAARLYGYMNIPSQNTRMQCAKCANSSEGDELIDIADFLAEEMEPDTLYLIGPGSTTARLKERLGIDGTLLGIDAVMDGKLIAKDANEPRIWELLQGGGKVRIIVTIIGGQGLLFGRGNQQLSPRILRRLGRDSITVAATRAKLLQLQGRPLWVDTGDEELDRELSGYMEVVVGYQRTLMYKVSY